MNRGHLPRSVFDAHQVVGPMRSACDRLEKLDDITGGIFEQD
jgi:hypothetical protein